MNVVMISPGYPTEMPYFTRGLAKVGAKVLGVGDQPESSLPPETRESLTAYLRVPSLVVGLRQLQRRVRVDAGVVRLRLSQ